LTHYQYPPFFEIVHSVNLFPASLEESELLRTTLQK
jgi:hypothetical protein